MRGSASGPDIVILFVYLGVMVVVGVLGWRKSQSSSDYLLAGRRLGYATYVGCLAAVVLGGASTVGTARLGYVYGLSGIWLVTMIGLGIVALGALLGTKLARLRVVSISEMLEKRYDRRSRLMSALITAVYGAMVSATQVIAMGAVLSPMLGWSPAACVILGGLVVLAYTFLGGMWSVSMTDLIQFAIMTVGVFGLMVPLGLRASGGFGALRAQLSAPHFRLDTIGYSVIFSYFLLFFLGLLIGQDIWQRVFTARDEKVARNGTILAGLYCVAYAFAMVLIGMVATVSFPELSDPQAAFATVAVELLPVGVSGIVLAASLAALMSTASGSLLAAATVLSNDVYGGFLAPGLDDRALLRVSRGVTLALGVVVVLVSLLVRDVILALDIAYTFLTGAVFVPALAAFFWKRATPGAAFWSMALSTIVAAVSMVVWGAGSAPPIVLGLATSFVVLTGMSLSPSREVAT